jgi:hypothetical protein
MPVCDARTQNGDRAFSYMVIDNIFISGVQEVYSILYYYGVTEKHWQTLRLAVLRSEARVMIGPREAGARLVPQMPRCAPGANLRFGLGSSENHRPRGGGRCSRGAARACALGSSQNRLRREGGSRFPPVLVVRLSSVSPLIIQRDAHRPQRRAVSGGRIGKSCAQGRSYLNVSPDRLLS